MKLNENVKMVLLCSLWDLATCSKDGMPNVVPVTFKGILDDGTLTVGDIFLETTLRNLEENGGRIAISVYDAPKLEGYQIQGTAEHVTEGKIVDEYRAMVERMFNGAATANGALIITPDRVIVTSPGPDTRRNCKEMYQKKREADIRCPLEYGLEIFGGKWDSRVICVLNEKKVLRYSEIRKEMMNVTDAVLSATLKKLIAHGLVERKSYDEIPPRTEYSLTDSGRSVVPILRGICMWAGIFKREDDSAHLMAQCQRCDFHRSGES